MTEIRLGETRLAALEAQIADLRDELEATRAYGATLQHTLDANTYEFEDQAKVIADAKAEQREADAQIAHMVHYAAECSTDGMLPPITQTISNTAFKIAAEIRKGGE